MKRLLSLVMLLLLAFSLTACSLLDYIPGFSGGTVFDTLDKALGAEYSALRVTVAVEDGELELMSEYTLTDAADGTRTITFREERFAEFAEVGGVYVAPDEPKTATEGSLTVKDGKVIESWVLGGAGVVSTRALATATYPRFHFTEEAFGTYSDENGIFCGYEVDADAFLGHDTDIEITAVTVVYTEERIQSLSYTYRDGDATVTVTYRYS